MSITRRNYIVVQSNNRHIGALAQDFTACLQPYNKNMFMKQFFITTALGVLCAFTMQAQLVVQSGAVLKTTGGATITLNNTSLVNDGTINQQPGEGKFLFTGNLDNTISGSTPPLFDIIEIAKTGTAKISLLQNINIGNTVNFTSGLIDMASNNILMQPNALLNGETENSRITATGNGYIEITDLLAAPSAKNLGNLGAVISSLQNLGSTTIRRGHTSQVNGINAGSSIFRYFDITPTNNTNLNATLRLNYFDAELNSLPENSLVLWKSTNTTTWINMGFDSRDATINYVEKTGLADFSRWTLSSLTNPLPVNFILFNVACNNTSASIMWTTAQEQNTSKFDIEKSSDGIVFTTIGTVPAAGNSNIEKTYYFTDNNNSTATTFYRIAETDRNGRIQYTAINRLHCGTITDYFKVWPNPAQQVLFANLYAEMALPVTFKIVDSKGALVLLQKNNLAKGSNQLNINISLLASGIYQMIAEWDNGKNYKTTKLIKQ